MFPYFFVQKHVSEVSAMRDYPVGAAVFLAVLSIFALFAGFFLVLTGGGNVCLPTLVLWALLGVVSDHSRSTTAVEISIFPRRKRWYLVLILQAAR